MPFRALTLEVAEQIDQRHRASNQVFAREYLDDAALANTALYPGIPAELLAALAGSTLLRGRGQR